MSREGKLLNDALKREREHRRIQCLEQFSTYAHSFVCVGCGHCRKVEESRDGSLVCVHCARRIGLPE